MKNLHNHHRYNHCRIFTPSVVQSPAHFLPAPTLAFAVPLTFSILFMHFFCCFLEVFFFSHRHVLQACVWAHSSLHNPRNGKSCQSQLSCHHQNGFWVQIQRWHLVWSCTFWPVFPKFVLGTVAFPGWRTSMTICFHWSSRLVMSFLIWIVTVSFMMAADLQADREERSGVRDFCFWLVFLTVIAPAPRTIPGMYQIFNK